MKSLHIEVNESIFDRVMFFLGTLPKKDVKIKVENDMINSTKETKRLKAISIDTTEYKFKRDEAHER